jgi:Arc/MetJ family transcription regulator
MTANLSIDIELLDTAQDVSGLKTKKDTVNLALKEFIERHKQKEILKFLNKIDYDESYDYKNERNRAE